MSAECSTELPLQHASSVQDAYNQYISPPSNPGRILGDSSDAAGAIIGALIGIIVLLCCGIVAYCFIRPLPPHYEDKAAVDVEMNPGVGGPPSMGDGGGVVMMSPDDIEKLEAEGMEIGVE